jgi:hypothetical protein
MNDTLLDTLENPGHLRGESSLAAMKGASARWLDIAERLKPPLRYRDVLPLRCVNVVDDPEAFQGCRMEPGPPLPEVLGKPIHIGDSFILDFGEHLTGRLSFDVIEKGAAVDTPLRLSFIFAEVPAELQRPFDPYTGTLSRAWLQDETLTLDILPTSAGVPRRCSFRYAKVTVMAVRDGRLAFSAFRVRAEACVEDAQVPPLPDGYSPSLGAIDAVALRTLRECMQTVFEDGPKRDRRLWLGDLRLQALTNAVSFRHFDLVKRCLYLFAALPLEDGMVSACVYENPVPRSGETRIPDYAALFADCLLSYARESGDRDTAKDLWPVALRQVSVLLARVDSRGLFHAPEKGWWLFIDWNPVLDRQAPLQGAVLFCLKRTLELGRFIGLADVALRGLEEARLRMEAATRERLWDPDLDLYVSGPSRQVSVLSQAWMILAGLCPASEASAILSRVLALPDAIRPVSPYGWHYLLEACLAGDAKTKKMGTDIMERYWGGMCDRGADTFWEVFDPENQTLSPYNDHRVNSYCHAWSCSPSWFLRKKSEN